MSGSSFLGSDCSFGWLLLCVLARPFHERERGLGCFCAALSFSGEQRTWRLAKTPKSPPQNPVCAHTGALEPKEGYPLHCFPLL